MKNTLWTLLLWGGAGLSTAWAAVDLSIEQPKAPVLQGAVVPAAPSPAQTVTAPVPVPAAPTLEVHAPPPAPAMTTATSTGVATTGITAEHGIIVKQGQRETLLASRHEQPVWWHFDQRWPVYVIDFPNTEQQGRVFARIVVFIERLGTSRTQVMSESQLDEWLQRQKLDVRTLTVGNNYRLHDLVAFFNAAQQQRIPLRAEEHWLLGGLRLLSLVSADGRGYWKTNRSAVVLSLPQVSEINGCTACSISAEGRRAVFEHEFAHALYFSNEALAQHLKWYFQNRLSANSRKRFISFLGQRGYDTENPDIVVNEFYAFVLHTPNRDFFDPLQVLGVDEAELKAMHDELNQALQPMLDAPAP